MSGDPALVYDITPLKREPGRQFPFVLSTASTTGVELSTAEVAVVEIHLDLLLESVGEQLVAQGTVGMDWTGPCRRCLERQRGRTEVEIREVFEKIPVEGETYALAENEVDLGPMVREAVLLNLPIAPLCSDSCRGPDPDRFPAAVAVDAPHTPDDADPPIDPRWAGLDALSFDE